MILYYIIYILYFIICVYIYIYYIYNIYILYILFIIYTLYNYIIIHRYPVWSHDHFRFYPFCSLISLFGWFHHPCLSLEPTISYSRRNLAHRSQKLGNYCFVGWIGPKKRYNLVKKVGSLGWSMLKPWEKMPFFLTSSNRSGLRSPSDLA